MSLKVDLEIVKGFKMFFFCKLKIALGTVQTSIHVKDAVNIGVGMVGFMI